MATPTKPVPLFGGAITINLPTDYKDASEIRDIPSNQELFLSTSPSTTPSSNTSPSSTDSTPAPPSLIIELLEYAQPPEHPCTTDEEALRYHYDDMVAAGYTSAAGDVEEDSKFYWEGEATVPEMAVNERDSAEAQGGKEGARAVCAVGLQIPRRRVGCDGQSEDQTEGDGGKGDFTALLVTLIRLPAKETDILVTVSVPHVRGKYEAGSVDFENGVWGPLIERGIGVRRGVWESFEVGEWGLFDG